MFKFPYFKLEIDTAAIRYIFINLHATSALLKGPTFANYFSFLSLVKLPHTIKVFIVFVFFKKNSTL